jgi:hypothetical protein
MGIVIAGGAPLPAAARAPVGKDQSWMEFFRMLNTPITVNTPQSIT